MNAQEKCRKCSQLIRDLAFGGNGGLFGTCGSCLKAKQRDQIKAQQQTASRPEQQVVRFGDAGTPDLCLTSVDAGDILYLGTIAPIEPSDDRSLKCQSDRWQNHWGSSRQEIDQLEAQDRLDYRIEMLEVTPDGRMAMKVSIYRPRT